MTDDGFSWLEQDHRDIEEQFQTFLRDNEEPVVRAVCEHLTRHSQTEDAALYPALRRFVDGGDDLADRAQQEHAAIATIVAELYQSTTPERLVDQVSQLREVVSAHVEFEESELFPAMRSCGVDGAQLLRDVQEAQAHEPSR
jgi:hemerythrin superfamily protein